jgi:hypothetical protein
LSDKDLSNSARPTSSTPIEKFGRLAKPTNFPFILKKESNRLQRIRYTGKSREVHRFGVLDKIFPILIKSFK